MTPDTFGPYQLRQLIGRGGMGEVHRAYDTRRQRTVALKRLRTEFVADEKFRDRFLKECRRAARLTQAHIIPIHDFGEVDGRLYLDMRLIEGANLAEAVAAAGPFPPERAVEVVGQVAGALDAAHSAGIVHRDVKPSNVLLETRGPDMHCYLADFGVAGAIGDTGGVSGTATGGMLGTYDYIAPERLLGRPSDHRVDVYALACLLYEVVAGTPPFPRTEVPAMIHAHLNVEPPRASEVVAGVPPLLDVVIARGMAKNPQARYGSAGELAAAARAAVLEDRVTSPAEFRPAPEPSASSAPTGDTDADTVPVRPPRRPRRRPLKLALSAALALMIAGASTAATWFYLRPVVQLEAADYVGAEPPFIPEDLNTSAAPPPSTQTVVPAAVSVVTGDTPGLYGGTKTNQCNVDGIDQYLRAHPDRGQAWARAQGIDPGAIHTVLTSLTPVTLRTDTAVTNHGFKNGTFTQFQSVLQAGTAVLVDVRGVPRVRCYCGNPLLRPEQPQSVRYEGRTWTDFSQKSVTVVKTAAAPVKEFVVVEPETKKVVSRPRATSGDKDRDADPAVVEKVKDKPIGDGTASRSDASTAGGEGAKGPDEDTPADGPGEPDNSPPKPGGTGKPNELHNYSADLDNQQGNNQQGNNQQGNNQQGNNQQGNNPPGTPQGDNPPANPNGVVIPGADANPNNKLVAPAGGGGPADQPAPPAAAAPAEEEPVKTDPVEKELVKTGPVKKDPVKKDPIKKDPIKKPVTKEQPPVKNGQPAKGPTGANPPASDGGSKQDGDSSGSAGGSGSGDTKSGGTEGSGKSGGGDSGSDSGGSDSGGSDSGGGDSGGGDSGGGDSGGGDG